MDDYGRYFEDIANDMRQSREARKLANHLFGQWQAGVVPSPSRVAQLRKMLDQNAVCGRLEGDGSCAWLRKFSRMEGFAPPAPGAKIYCQRKAGGSDAERYDGCEGFTKARD